MNFNHGIAALKDEIPWDKPIVIYGAGGCGDFAFRLLKDSGYQISCYLVSDGFRDQAMLNGIPVIEVSEFPWESEPVNVVVATTQPFGSEMVRTAERCGADGVYTIGLNMVGDLYQSAYTEWSQAHGIDLTAPILKIHEWEFRNLFQEDPGFRFAFYSELGDCVLPSITGELSLVNEGPYEYDEVCLNAGDVVMDCGSNIGLFASVAASKGCQVYAFEPFAEVAAMMLKACFRFKDQIHWAEYALTDNVGDVLFRVDFSSTGGSVVSEGDARNLLRVPSTTIDAFVDAQGLERVDFIKADIEGAEKEMLKGAYKTLARFSPKLAICTYHQPGDPEALEAIIKAANPAYVVKHRWKKLYAHVPSC